MCISHAKTVSLKKKKKNLLGVYSGGLFEECNNGAPSLFIFRTSFPLRSFVCFFSNWFYMEAVVFLEIVEKHQPQYSVFCHFYEPQC